MAATVVTAAARETAVATATVGAHREVSVAGMKAGGVATNGANHPLPSHVQQVAPAATTAPPAAPFPAATTPTAAVHAAAIPAAAVHAAAVHAAITSGAEVTTFRGEAPGGCLVVMLIASANGAIAGAAETKAARVQIATQGSTTAMVVFGGCAVIQDRTAPGETYETTLVPCNVLLLAASGLSTMAETATALARQAKGADIDKLPAARESGSASTTITAVTLMWTKGGGRRAATSAMTVGEGALVAAGGTTAKANAARS